MTFKDIRGALMGPIDANSEFGIQFADENVPFDPVSGTPYAEAFILPNQPEQASLGPTGTDIHDGVMQINVRYPENDGTSNILDKVEEIATAYKSGQTLTYNSASVRLDSVGRTVGTNEQGWYRIDLNINWFSFVNRS